MSSTISHLCGFFTSSHSKEAVESFPDVDWTSWIVPGEGDGLNALANHGILPHSGKEITKEIAVKAMTEGFHIDSSIASTLASVAILANPDHTAHTFDLDHLSKHGFIEHDCSLSRIDAAFGNQAVFSEEIFEQTLKELTSRLNLAPAEGPVMTTWKAAAEARYDRVLASKEKHENEGKTWSYGLKEAFTSYSETCLYLNLLGKDGAAPLEWVKIFFEEERLPYMDGWRPPPKITQSMMNHGFLEMIKANEHESHEAVLIGIGTFEAAKAAFLSLGPSAFKIAHAKE